VWQLAGTDAVEAFKGEFFAGVGADHSADGDSKEFRKVFSMRNS
jgi:hypothetical protein